MTARKHKKRNTAHPKGTRASTSFRKDEVAAVTALFESLLRGGDASTFLRSVQGRKVMAKFIHMRDSIAERRSGV